MTPTPHGQVPEALRLAEILEGDYCPDWFYEQGVDEVSAELRRLHAENATLQSGYDAARLEIDGLHARVQELERERDNYKLAYDKWHDKTEWVQQTAQPRELGMHRADVLRERIERAAAAEREVCACFALICGKDAPTAEERDMARAIAAAIRARGAQGESNAPAG